MKRTKSFPTLYQKAKSGKIYQWTIWTEGPEVVTEYGTIDGEKIIAKYTAEPKNVGRANETTAAEQAISEAQSTWTKKKDKKYVESVADTKEEQILPMLAHPAEKKLHKITYPAYLQRKFNGVRCMAMWVQEEPETYEVYLMSRGNKEYHVDHIAQELRKVLGTNDVLDGEIYLHGTSLQNINKLVKKHRPGESEALEYHIYDYPIINGDRAVSQEKRVAKLAELKKKIAEKKCTHLKIVDTIEINSFEEAKKKEKEWVKEGYEGAILRQKDAIYNFGNRSEYLLKVKSFKDAEFEITGYEIEETNVNGEIIKAVVWVCANDMNSPDGTVKTFKVRPQGSKKDRAEQLEDVDNYIGKKLTVKYFDRTDDLVPQFGVGICVRLDEDQP